MNVERLVLTEEQSAHIRAEGITFAVVHPGSYPENAGRYVLDLIECDYATASAAVEVAQGKRKPGRRCLDRADG